MDEEPQKQQPRYNSRVPDEELEPGEVYSFPDEPKEHKQELSETINEPDSSATARKKKKKKKKRQVTEEQYDRILDREDPPEPYAWWAVPAGLAGFGILCTLITVTILSLSAKEQSIRFSDSVLVLVGAAAAVVIQTMLFTVLLWFVGTFFGIDYGPVVPALGRIAAVIIFTNGLTLVFMQCTKVGIMFAGVIAVGVFQSLFRLSFQESILSCAGIVLGSTALNMFLILLLFQKAAGG